MERQLELTAESLWTGVSGRLREALNETTYRTWFGQARGLELSEDTFVIAVPSDFAKAWIGGHFLELIRAAVVEAAGTERDIALAVQEPRSKPQAEPLDSPARAAPDGRGECSRRSRDESDVRLPGSCRPVPRRPG